jgi:hypothetical protein
VQQKNEITPKKKRIVTIDERNFFMLHYGGELPPKQTQMGNI